MKVYRTKTYGTLIQEIEAKEITLKSVKFLDGTFARTRGVYYSYFDSLEIAKESLKEHFENEIIKAEAMISEAKINLEKLNHY